MTNPLAITALFFSGVSAGAFVSYLGYRSALCDYRKAIECTFADLKRNKRTSAHYRMKALILCRDPETAGIFSQLFREVGIEPQQCDSGSQAIDELMSDKFEALVLDFDNFPECTDIAKIVREIRPNHAAQVFALVSVDQATTTALSSGSTFVLRRPPAPSQIRSLVQTVYGRMLRNSQAYFRLNCEFTVSIARASGPLLKCTTINISQNGMAVITPGDLRPGESLHLVFVIPHTDIVVGAEGTVIWADGHGKAGIRFECSSAPAQARFIEWLNGHFFMKFEGAPSMQDSSELHATTN